MSILRTERQALFTELTRVLSRRYRNDDGLVVCQFCGRGARRWEIHEWFVKRNALPKEKQAHIFCVENCVPLCRECHEQYGNTNTGLRTLLLRQSKTLGPKAVADWYRGLGKHGIIVREPVVPEKKDWPVQWAMPWIRLMFAIHGEKWELDWSVATQHGNRVDWRSWVFMRWTNKRPRWGKGGLVTFCNGLTRERFEGLCEDAYWLMWLSSVKGIDRGELLETWTMM